MADRIIAALDYLDAHTSIVLQKNKHRSLGDIDAKYDVIDPTELNSVVQSHVTLSGTRRTNLSRGKTVEEILEEDRVRMVKSAHTRTRSAPNSKLTSRPMTSASFAGSFPSQRNGSTHTSVKRLSFTPPGVSVGPSNVRDDVMEDKVIKTKINKNHKNINNKRTQDRARTANSAPTYGRGYLSIGCRSLSSIKRPKTYHVGSTRSNSSSRWQRKPGPFAKVKVGASDMWVVSESTPTSYFDGDVINTKSVDSSRLPRWEEQADSIPREEKKSPPRFERQLGAPPQFGNEGQWYTFSGKDPTKYRPVLTAFTDKNDTDWYNIESRVSDKVANQVIASPGIRIGRNGNVVSNSMKVNNKLAPKGGEDSGLSESDDEDFSESQSEKSDNKSESPDDKIQSKDGSENDDVDSLSSGDPDKDILPAEETPELREEDKMFSLLRYIGVSGTDNPYVTDSLSSTKSSSDVSIFTSIYGKQGLVKSDDKEDEHIWKALEGASPHLWVSRDRWGEMRMNIARRKIKAKLALQNAEASAPPLSWEDQVIHGNAKVLETKLKTEDENVKNKNTSLPVVFRKLLNCDQLPSGFLHMTSSGYRSHSSVAKVDTDLNVTSPSKGHNLEIPPPLRSVKSSLLTRNPNEVAFPPRPYTTETPHSDVTSGIHNRSVELGSFLRTNETSKAKNENEEFGDRDDVTDDELEAMRVEAAMNMKMMGDVTEGESPVIETKQSYSKEDTENKKENAVTLNSLPVKSETTISTVEIRSNENKKQPVTSLNLKELQKEYNLVHGPNLPSPTSPTRESLSTPPNSISNVPRFSLNLKSPGLFSHQEDQEVPKSGDRDKQGSKRKTGTRSASIVTRSPANTSRNNTIQINSDTSPPRSNRPSGGFSASPLTGRPSHTTPATRFGGVSKPVRVISAATINYDPELGFSLTGEPPKGTPSGFIQIAHSLHIPTTFKSKKTSLVGARSKMIDSYMHELSSRDDVKKTETSGIVGKSLGGTSGRAIPGTWVPGSPQKLGPQNLKGCSQSFSIHGGRKLGLAITNEHSGKPPIRIPDRDPRDLLNLHGDQVRLNLDKNIHVIYRDLGIPKKSRIGSMPNSPIVSKTMNFDDVTERRSQSASRRSDGTRSTPMSAKSRPATGHRSATSERSVVVTIPTVPTSQFEHTSLNKNQEITSESIRLGDIIQTVNDVTNNPTAQENTPKNDVMQKNLPSTKRLHINVTNQNNVVNGAEIIFSSNENLSKDGLVDDVIKPIGDVKCSRTNKTKQVVVDSGTQYSPHREFTSEHQDSNNSEKVIDYDVNTSTDDVTTTVDQEMEQNAPETQQNKNNVSENFNKISNNKKPTSSQKPEENLSDDVIQKSVLYKTDVVTQNVITSQTDDATQFDDFKQNNINAQKNDVINDVTEHKALRHNRRSISESQIDLNGYHSDKDVTDDVTEDEVTVRGITKVTVNITSLAES